jgi:hypothetical protein
VLKLFNRDVTGEVEWTFGDAWFAAAVATSQQPASLDDIIGAGDAINHAIFTNEEIVHAVQLLVGSGLMEAKPTNSFKLTSVGHQLLNRRRGGLIGQTASVQRLLRTVVPQTVPWTIDASQIASATERYLRGMGRFGRQARPT